MTNKTIETKYLDIKIDSEHLSANQIRLIKAINSMITHVLTTSKEDEYFDGSADLIRMCGALVKQALFTEINTKSSIPYGEQALEYAVDLLKEHMEQSKVVTYDN